MKIIRTKELDKKRRLLIYFDKYFEDKISYNTLVNLILAESI